MVKCSWFDYEKHENWKYGTTDSKTVPDKEAMCNVTQ